MNDAGGTQLGPRLGEPPEPMPPLSAQIVPEGSLLALLVTDLEGFTTLVEELGDELARELIQRHDRLVREPIVRHQGREIAHTGDGVMAAFRSVRSALSAAAEIQHALATDATQHVAPLRARIGVHVGEPLPEDGRLIGLCVNTAARVCSVAHGEQVLVTELARNLAAGTSFRFGPGSAVSLKGLRAPVTVQELMWREPDAANTQRTSGIYRLPRPKPAAH